MYHINRCIIYMYIIYMYYLYINMCVCGYMVRIYLCICVCMYVYMYAFFFTGLLEIIIILIVHRSTFTKVKTKLQHFKTQFKNAQWNRTCKWTFENNLLATTTTTKDERKYIKTWNLWDFVLQTKELLLWNKTYGVSNYKSFSSSN